MSSAKYPVQSKGIYHNLPTFDPSVQNLTAIVTGANGISGFATMRVLLESPQRWRKVYALSRKPPPREMMDLLTSDQRSRVQHVAVDFLSDAKDIAKAMKDAGISGVEYVFFYSYLQPRQKPGQLPFANAQELVDVNKTLLGNFLEALTAADVKPKRFLLQTGAKNYGVHIGRTKAPCCESDPQPQHLEPNFYYPQEELLFKYCKTNGVGWNVIMPAWIIGPTTAAQINGFAPMAVYAAVQAHKGQSLQFPGDWTLWQAERFHATARLTGYLSEWAVLEDKCKNQRFNAQDTAPLSWERLWEELARWYGAKDGIERPSEDESKYQAVKGKGGKETPLGHGPGYESRVSFTFQDWAKQSENQQAWKEIMQKSGGKIKLDPFQDPVENFEMADFMVLPMAILNMAKARRLGWTGFVDTVESVFEMFKLNAEMGVGPPMLVDAANAMV